MMLRFVLALGIFFIVDSASARSDEHVIVVELFTSQGCSSCPQADALLADLSKLPELLVLSEHIDYWDYLGWRDPFASAENTRRQRAYAHRLDLSYVYTPQMIVHGARQATGSDRNSILQLIYEAQALPHVPLDIVRTPEGTFTVRLAKTALPTTADVWFVRFDRSHLTSVLQGENRGRKIENINVVRSFDHIAQWNGEAISLPLPASLPKGNEGSAVVVQQSNTGRILGAARLQASAD